MRLTLLSCFYTLGNGGIERLSNLSKVKLLISEGASIQTQVCVTWEPELLSSKHFCHPLSIRGKYFVDWNLELLESQCSHIFYMSFISLVFVLNHKLLKGSGTQLFCRNQKSIRHICFPVEIIYSIVKHYMGEICNLRSCFFPLICTVSVRMITDKNTLGFCVLCLALLFYPPWCSFHNNLISTRKVNMISWFKFLQYIRNCIIQCSIKQIVPAERRYFWGLS